MKYLKYEYEDRIAIIKINRRGAQRVNTGLVKELDSPLDRVVDEEVCAP